MAGEKDFLGTGWTFPVSAGADGISLSSHEDDIREAIRIILGTDKGERVMRPDFGCGARRYVFSPMGPADVRMVEREVREALMFWEPRIEVLGVRAEANSGGEGRLVVDIDYKVRGSNTRFNMVYPFHLKEGK